MKSVITRSIHRRSFLAAAIGVIPMLKPIALFGRSKALARPQVLILGDSISIGYTPFVREILQDIADVHRPMLENGKPENCAGTTKGLTEIERWIGSAKWDVIHFNFGLHDIKHVDPVTGKNSLNPKDPQQAKKKKYRKNLDKITQKLKTTQAHLIFATTTPYPNPVDGPLRQPGMPKRYNGEAMKVMKKHEVQINDLYAFVKPKMEELMRPRNVHFTEEGSKALADEVAGVIKQIVLRNP